MQTLIEALHRNAALVVEQFYDELSRLPRSRQILEMLEDEELVHLRAKQVQNLLALADTGLGPRAQADLALRVGRIHAIVGLDKEEFVRSRGILLESLYKLIGQSVSSQSLAFYGRRLTSDLAWQLKAYQRVQDSQQEALLRITRVVWEADGYTSFIDEVIRILIAHDEVAACAIGRPDEYGIFHFEAAARSRGEVDLLGVLASASHVVSVRADHPQGQGPIGRAWRSGKAERTINYRTDPIIAPWREVAEREGVRSSVAIPLAAPGRAPMAVLMLHSAYPGGFIGPDQVAFVELLQTLLGCAAARIHAQAGASEAVPIRMRQHWAALVRTGALQMHYQPILDLGTGHVGKVEALARLADGHGLVQPGQFLPALASDDLLALFSRGLGQSLADRNRWLAAGHDVDVSINLPPAGLNDIRYFDATRAALDTHGCPSARLTLEVTETEAISTQQGQRAILAKFRALGVKLAQDDLGSGHSGLARLRELPFDWIKIDRDLAHVRDGEALDVLRFVYQLTRLGHSLGKRVLVEGVDTPDLLGALALLGVDGAQGYVIAKPMDGDMLSGWLARPPLPAGAPAGESTLVRLARLLIWEERLALIAAAPEAAAILVDLLAARRAGRSAGADGPLWPLVNALTGMAPAGPGDAAAQTLQWDVIDALLAEGADSAVYAAARERLMASIVGAPAALAVCSEGCP